MAEGKEKKTHAAKTGTTENVNHGWKIDVPKQE